MFANVLTQRNFNTSSYDDVFSPFYQLYACLQNARFMVLYFAFIFSQVIHYYSKNLIFVMII